MIVRQVFEIRNQNGLHARAAVKIVELAKQFTAEITVTKEGEAVSGKNILELMMLAAAQDNQIEVAADGPDAEAALEAIGALIARGFDLGE